MEGAEEVAGVEEVVVQFQDAGDDGELVEDARLVEQRVDAVRVLAFEVVASGHGVGTAEAVDFIARFSRFGSGEAVGQDYIAVFEDVLDVGAERGVGGKRLERSASGVEIETCSCGRHLVQLSPPQTVA